MNHRMNGKRYSLHWWELGLVIVMLVFGLVGCGSSSNNDSGNTSSSKMVTSNSVAVSPEAPSMGVEFNESSEPAAKADAPQAEVEDAKASDIGNSDPSLGTAATDFSAYDRKLIYNANVVLEVEDYGDAQTKLLNMVTLAGGYMLNFSDVKSEYESGGVFVIKVPSKGFHPFVTKLEELKKKDTKAERSIQGKDVTEEYVDIESRLKAKQVVEARLLDFMEKATDTKNLLQFSNQLALVQEEIEAIKGRMRYIDQNVAFSTVEIRMYEKEAKALTQKEKKDNVLTRAGDAMKGSGKAVLAMFEGIFIVLAGAIPILIVLGLIAVIIGVIYRKTRYTGTRDAKGAYVTPVVHEQAAVPQVGLDKEVTKEDEQGSDQEK
ncbi:MAG: DUF4349 domain-containing protein [Paenibacillaceae bacterium]